MVVLGGGKGVSQMLGLGGKGGVGQILAAVAAALLLRLFSGPGPALLPEDDGDGESDDGEALDTGKYPPVTLRWSNITCSLSDKSSKAVSLSFSLSNNIPQHFLFP